MPTYEFRCPDGHLFEKFFRTISDSVSEVPCTQCGATAVRQISGGGGLLFKGSGFYLTDYGKNAHRSSGNEPKPGGEKAAAGDGKSPGEGKASSDSKPTESKPAEAKPAAPKEKPKPTQGSE